MLKGLYLDAVADSGHGGGDPVMLDDLFLPDKNEDPFHRAASHIAGVQSILTGIAIAHVLEDINAYFYEEPCPFDDLWSTKAVTDSVAIPLAFGNRKPACAGLNG